MTPNKQKLIERLLHGGDDLFTSFVIAGLEENLEIICDEVKAILSMDRILGHRMADLIELRADGEATIRILKYYGAGDYPVAAELMAKAVGIQEWECSLEDDAQPIPALKDAQERTKGMLTEADAEMSKHFVEMADRIEGLEELLWAAENDAKEAEAYVEELEAKLAKAEDIIHIVASDKWGERMGEAVDLSCEYLAELKGQDDGDEV